MTHEPTMPKATHDEATNALDDLMSAGVPSERLNDAMRALSTFAYRDGDALSFTDTPGTPGGLTGSGPDGRITPREFIAGHLKRLRQDLFDTRPEDRPRDPSTIANLTERSIEMNRQAKDSIPASLTSVPSNPWKAETRNFSLQGMLLNKNPELAAKLMRQAGVR